MLAATKMSITKNSTTLIRVRDTLTALSYIVHRGNSLSLILLYSIAVKGKGVGGKE